MLRRRGNAGGIAGISAGKVMMSELRRHAVRMIPGHGRWMWRRRHHLLLLGMLGIHASRVMHGVIVQTRLASRLRRRRRWLLGILGLLLLLLRGMWIMRIIVLLLMRFELHLLRFESLDFRF